MRISDWSSDVCSSDLQLALADAMDDTLAELLPLARLHAANDETADTWAHLDQAGVFGICASEDAGGSGLGAAEEALIAIGLGRRLASPAVLATLGAVHCAPRSEEHTSELQSLMRIS